MAPANLPDFTKYGVPIHYAGCYKPTAYTPANSLAADGVTIGVQKCLSDGNMEQYAFLGTTNAGTFVGCSAAVVPSQKDNDYNCNTACSNEPNVLCGSGDGIYFSVYYMNTYSHAVTPYQLTKPVEVDASVTSALANYIGCFPTSALTLDPSVTVVTKVNASMTVEMCVDFCAAQNLLSAWVTGSTSCNCGKISNPTTNFAKYSDDACDASCPGYSDGTAPAGGTAKCGGKTSDFPNDATQVRNSVYTVNITPKKQQVAGAAPFVTTNTVRPSSLNASTSLTLSHVGCIDATGDKFFQDPTLVYNTVAVPYPELLTVQQCLNVCDPGPGGNVTWTLVSSDLGKTWPNGGAAGGCQCLRKVPTTGQFLTTQVPAAASSCAKALPGDNQHTAGTGRFVDVYAQSYAPRVAQNFTTVTAGVPVSYYGCFQAPAKFDMTTPTPVGGYLAANDKCLSSSYTAHFTSIYSDANGNAQVLCSDKAPDATSTKVADSLCSAACTDDVNVGCGGNAASSADPTVINHYASVYLTNSFAFSFPPYPVPKPVELDTTVITATMTYGGCLPISKAPTDLRTILNSNTLTEAGCVDLCLQYGFITAVLQNSTICGCSSSGFTASASPNANPESNCNAVCPGYNATANTIGVPHCGSVPIPVKVVTPTDPNAPVVAPPPYVPYGSFYALQTSFLQARTDKPNPLGAFNYSSLMNNASLSVSYTGCYPISDPVLQRGPYRFMDTPYPRLLTIQQCIHACDPMGTGIAHPVLKQIGHVNWPNGANSECQCITGVMANLTSTPDESKCFSLLPGDNTHTMGYDDYVSVYSVVGPNNGTVSANATANSTVSGNSSMPATSGNATSIVSPSNVSASISVSASGSVSASVSMSGMSSSGSQSVTGSGASVSSSNPSSTTSSTGPSSTPMTQASVVASFQVNGMTYRSQGCWGEPAQQPSTLRALPNRLYPSQQTVEACLTMAAMQGFKKAGLENGGECWASNGQVAGGAIPATYCLTPCADNGSEICGGSNNLILYFADGASSGAMTVPSHTSGNNQWVYSSCWGEPAQGRALPNKIIDSGATVGACLDLAASRGYGYAGLEWYGECWAAFSAPAGGQIDESYCNLACSSDATQECGGSGALSYYKLKPVTKVTVSLASSTWQYQSCYGEPAQGRSMPNPFDNSVGATVESCLQMGAAAGFKNCGLEYGQECWCSNDKPYGGVIPESFCNMPCNKDNREICGSGNVLSFYSKL